MDEEALNILRENKRMLKELLVIVKKFTDPDNLSQENENDFYMNILANLIAKKIENKFKL